ncbi:MAG: CopD family protein, partial [Caulobacteraceae bacterium]
MGIDWVAVLARLAEYVGSGVLAGSSLTLWRARSALGAGWATPLFLAAAALLLAGSVAGFADVTARATGVPADAFNPAAWARVLSGADFGPPMAARIALGAAALGVAATVGAGGRLGLALLVVAGAAALASFAWTGHGASDMGLAGDVHLGADVVHLLAAGVWLGALAVFAGVLSSRKRAKASVEALAGALSGFAGVGSAAVAALLATGLVNAWFLVGPAHVADLFSTLYGRLLAAKVALFLGMTALAAANRWVL